MDHWLTPDAPGDGVICRSIRIPNSVEFLALVSGCLLELTRQYNWEKWGSMTPAQVAGLFQVMFDDFSLGREPCRMIGELIPYAAVGSPSANWLPCDGSLVSKTTYADLYALIGSTYGPGDPDNFALPDFRGRSPLGIGAGTGLSARSIGETGGEETHVITTTELASHAHSASDHYHSEGTSTATTIIGGVETPQPAAIPSVGITGSSAISIGAAGGDTGHNTMHPFLAINWLIVAL